MNHDSTIGAMTAEGWGDDDGDLSEWVIGCEAAARVADRLAGRLAFAVRVEEREACAARAEEWWRVLFDGGSTLDDLLKAIRGEYSDQRGPYPEPPQVGPSDSELLTAVVVAADRLIDNWAESDEQVKRILWRNLAAATEAAHPVVYPL